MGERILAHSAQNQYTVQIMPRFVRVLAGMLAAPFNPFGGVLNVINFVVSVVSLLLAVGITIAAALNFLPIPWWTASLILLVAYLVAVIMFSAWEKTRRASITVGPLNLDAPNKVFWVTVTNGPTASKVKGFIKPVSDSFGTRHTDRSWEGHWRTQKPDFDGDLKPDEEADYGWVQASQFKESGNPTLAIFTRQEGEWLSGQPLGHRMVPISRDVELESQGTTTLNTVMTCNYPDGKEAMKVIRTYVIAPDPGSSVGYKILQLNTRAAATQKPLWIRARRTLHEISSAIAFSLVGRRRRRH